MTNKGDLTGLETIWRCWQICEILEIFTKHSPNFPKRFLLSPNLLYSPCYHNTVAMMFIVLSLHLQLNSTTMLFKQAYGFLLSIHLQVLVTTVRCLSKLTRHILPQFYVNKVNVSYGIFTLTNPLCHCHVTNFSYHPLTPSRSMLSQYSFSVFIVWIPCYHSALPYHVPT